MEAENQLGKRAIELLATLRGANPLLLATRTGARYDEGILQIVVWDTAVSFTFPDFTPLIPLDTLTHALLAYYLTRADGTPLTRKWIAFSDLPDGRFYTAAFQGYTGNELARVFGNRVETLAETAVSLGGHAVNFADRAVAFRVLPHVAVMVACWQGDEDFPPSYRLLFDANTCHHLPTDACAIIGSTLTRRLIQEHKQK